MAAAKTAHHLDRRSIIFVFAGLMTSMFVGSLDQTIVSTALPTIVGELGGATHMLWVTTAYVLAATVTMPLYGKVGDLIGRKGLFIGALGLFVAGSLVCGSTTSMEGLVAGRAVQGLGGGGLMILSQAIVADVVPPRKRALYLSAIGLAYAVPMVIGPLLGGLFTDTLGWRWCFWINVPLGLAALAAAAVFLPHRDHGKHPVRSLDLAGAAAMVVAATCLILVISWGGGTYAWDSPVIVGLAVAGVAAAVAFVLAERRAADPLIPLSFFKNRTYLICTAAGLLIMVGMMGAISYLPTYFQIVSGLGATAAGYMTIPMMAGMMLTSTAAGFIASRTGRVKWMPLASCAVAAAVFALLSGIAVDTSLVEMGVLLFALGFGIGLVNRCSC